MPTEVFEKISKNGVPITRAKITERSGIVRWQTWRTPESTLAKYVDELYKDCREVDVLDFQDKYNGFLYTINEDYGYYVEGHNGIHKHWVPTKNRMFLPSSGQDTLLQWAVDFGLIKAVKQLIQIGADVNVVDHEQTTEEIKTLFDNAAKIRSDYLRRHPEMPKLWHETWGTLDWKNTPDKKLNEQVNALLKDNADVFIRAKEDGPTAVHFAANYGYVQTLQTLIDNHADTDTYATCFGEDDVSPLYLAAKNGHTEVIEKLLKFGENEFYDYAAALDTAIENGHIKTAQKLFELANTDADYAKNYQRRTEELLVKALKNGHIKTIQKLAEWGVDIGTKDKYGRTVLHLAARDGYTKEIETLIKKLKADINEKDNDKKTPLHWAALYGRSDVVEKLIELGAYINEKDNNGRNVLYYAVMGCPDEVIQKLIEVGCDVKARSKNGWSAFDVSKRESTKDLLRNAEKIRANYLARKSKEKIKQIVEKKKANKTRQKVVSVLDVLKQLPASAERKAAKEAAVKTYRKAHPKSAERE